MPIEIRNYDNQMSQKIVRTQTQKRNCRAGKPGSPLGRLLQLSLEGVFGAVAGLGEIAVGAVLHGIGVAVTELVFHGVVSALTAFVRLLRTFSAVGVVEKMIAGAFRHYGPFVLLK
jgi:hypothetical protein